MPASLIRAPVHPLRGVAPTVYGVRSGPRLSKPSFGTQFHRPWNVCDNCGRKIAAQETTSRSFLAQHIAELLRNASSQVDAGPVGHVLFRRVAVVDSARQERDENRPATAVRGEVLYDRRGMGALTSLHGNTRTSPSGLRTAVLGFESGRQMMEENVLRRTGERKCRPLSSRCR